MLAAAEILPAPDWPDGWDQRPTIEPDIATIAARLHKALGAVLQGLHKPQGPRQDLFTSPPCGSMWLQIVAAVTSLRSAQTARRGYASQLLRRPESF